MANRTMGIAPTLLTILLAWSATTVSAAHAEPAKTSGASADCLTKPSGPSPQGSHWYYHLERATGRHCWYLRGQDAKAGENDTAKPLASVAPPARAGDDGRAIVPPITPPVTWPAAPQTSAVPEPAPADTRAGQIPQPSAPAAVESKTDLIAPLRKADADARPPRRNQAPPAAVERPPVVVAEPAHMPALLGIVLALAIIVIGSLGARLVVRLLRQPGRRLVDLPESDWDTPGPETHASPGIVPALPLPVMPRRVEMVRDTRPRVSDYAPRRDQARVLEDNVRELLRRLRTELDAKDTASVFPDSLRAKSSH